MDKTIVDELRQAANHGIAALKRRQTAEASQHFTKALDRAEDLQDPRTRRDELSALATLFEQYSFPDLSLTAAEETVDLDRTLGLDDLMAQDLLTVGNAHLNMENTAKAEAAYREAMAIFVAQNDFANAASATTNVAGIVANRGEMAPAIDLLEKSLGYLAKEPFDATEIQTRFALLQTMEIEQRDIDRAIDNARQLCARFWDAMPEVRRDAARDFIGKAVDRYLRAHPDVDAAAWKAANFPALYA